VASAAFSARANQQNSAELLDMLTRFFVENGIMEMTIPMINRRDEMVVFATELLFLGAPLLGREPD
jgi:hypothetical protein